MVPTVRSTILSIDPDQPLGPVNTMEDLIAASIGDRRTTMMLLVIFAGFAVILAALGIYGVMSEMVGEKSREIGIRMACGAGRVDLIRMVLRHGMILAVTGTAEGHERAIALADLLEDAGITAIHSTDYIRTRDTVVPLAERIELPITVYDPRNLAVKASLLKELPGRHIVSGHSNTTPELVRLLGGEPGPPFVEAGENDRLYIVTLYPDNRVETLILRFGKRFRPEE